MQDELASVRGIVDLSAQEALDRARAFLTQQGYTIVRRTDTSLTAERRLPDQAVGQDMPSLTVEALPQPGGGVQVRVTGNDREGVQQQQAAWVEWSENLPKKTDASTDEAGDQQRGTVATDAPLPPPPTVESPNLPPAPEPPPSYAPPPSTQGSGMGRGTKLAIGGCIVLVLLALLTVGGCFALVATVGPSTDSKSGDSTGKQQGNQKSGSSKGESTVAINEPVTVGDVTWTVTDAAQRNELTQQGISREFAKSERGNFVLVDFDFTNNGSETVTLDNESLALIDSQGRESKVNSDYFLYIPEKRRIFLERVNPGVTRQGRAIFEVAPGASGFKLQAGDTNMFTDENGYVDLGF